MHGDDGLESRGVVMRKGDALMTVERGMIEHG
jgi:hypothetical protein